MGKKDGAVTPVAKWSLFFLFLENIGCSLVLGLFFIFWTLVASWFWGFYLTAYLVRDLTIPFECAFQSSFFMLNFFEKDEICSKEILHFWPTHGFILHDSRLVYGVYILRSRFCIYERMKLSIYICMYIFYLLV